MELRLSAAFETLSVRMQRATAWRRPNEEDLVGDLFSKGVTLEPPRTN
jgi:hypothetical protein